MGKKDREKPVVATGPSAGLKHSPFAALAGATERTEAPAESATDETLAGPDTGSSRRGRLVLRRETKHRGGKTAVIVSGFETIVDLRAGEIDAIARELKQGLACGGTVEDNAIVLQGDRPAKVAELLRARGFRVAGVTS